MLIFPSSYRPPLNYQRQESQDIHYPRYCSPRRFDEQDIMEDAKTPSGELFADFAKELSIGRVQASNILRAHMLLPLKADGGLHSTEWIRAIKKIGRIEGGKMAIDESEIINKDVVLAMQHMPL
jgi:hypothetical protein